MPIIKKCKLKDDNQNKIGNNIFTAGCSVYCYSLLEEKLKESLKVSMAQLFYLWAFILRR